MKPCLVDEVQTEQNLVVAFRKETHMDFPHHEIEHRYL